eukprot:TRINITY_DN15877_c0_g1_i15.p1 TRINITY_DN15877_c0_g1~~TRINITY_DN15877_c0_g1_i15.p1  ORF type:complete len:297 (+),score=79.46 TRINITY_DN15877_c0_g1_i15:101-892(+)
MLRSLVGSEMCIRDRYQRRVRGAAMAMQWTSGICGCCGDPRTMCFAFCFLPCATASARSRFDSSNWCFNFCCVNGCVVRNIVREAYHNEGTCVSDICIPCCCPCCSVAQILREVIAKGSANSVNMITTTGQVVRMETVEGSNLWSSELTSCCDDCGSCLYACCCPWCANSSVMTKYDGSNWWFNCFAKQPCVAQSILREGKYNIDGTCCGDVLEPCCCYSCAISRLLREVKVRGPVQSPGALVIQQPAPGQRGGGGQAFTRQA